MNKQGGRFLFVLILSGLGLFVLAPNKLMAFNSNVVINEVQINGTGGTQEDFIELYNPSTSPFNLNGYRLVKRTKTGTSDTSIKSWTSDDFILANDYYLWANSANGFAVSLGANASTTQTIAADNGIALRLGKEDEGEIIDSLGWGECANIFVEGAVFPTNPTAGQSLVRQNFVDTNNNAADFIINIQPTPQGAMINNPGSVPVCGNGQLESGEECDDNNNVNGDGCNATCVIESSNNSTATTTIVATPSGAKSSGSVSFRWGEVVINELVTDPSDEDEEWIELYNTGSQIIDLSDWTIEDGSGAKTKLIGKLGASGADKFFVVSKPVGKLNNAGDLVALKYKDSLIDEVVYGNWDDGNKDNNAPVASDPNSIARKSDGYNTFNNQNDFAITTKVTKGASNVIALPESEAELTNNNWQTSQDVVISEVFPNPPGDDSKNEFIELYNKGDKSVDLIGWRLGDASDKRYQFKQATIIEPHEFLAIKRSSSSIALNNDEETVKLFVPQSDEPLQTVSYTEAPEGQSWNDANFTAENINNVGLVGVVKKWEWSSAITPGAVNIINAPSQPLVVDFDAPTQIEIGRPFIYDSSDTTGGATSSLKYQWDFGDNATSTLPNPEHTFFKTRSFKVKLTVVSDNDKASKTKTVKVVKVGALVKTGGVVVKGVSYSAEVTKVTTTKTTKKVASAKKTTVSYKTGTLASIEEINNYSKGDKLKVTGTVAVLPGVFGSQYFYIVGSGGLQIYNYKKDFPNLKVGDEITVNGELSAVSSEPRLKTTSAKDFSIVGHKDSLEPVALSYDNLGEEINGGLVKFSGEITEKKGSTIYLDDGNGELPVYLKKNTGLTAGSFTEGDNVEIAGILIKDTSGFKLLPRGRDDIKKAASSSGQVLGEVAPSDEWQLAQRDKTTEMLKYFLAIAIFMIVVLVGIIIRKMKK
jgi:cysteine-rich repeat protein